MRISGFTIARNAIKLNYPVQEAIRSILPICDEFIVNVGDSEDGTIELIRSMNSPKIKIVQRKWDMSLGEEVLTQETNFALSQCGGDWAFYIQTDELIHERDLGRLKKYMQKYLMDERVEGFRFKWLHFYGSFWRYRIDAGWFQKQDRIVRNNGQIVANKGAWGFQHKDGSPVKSVRTNCFIYHYSWVNDPQVMALRRDNAKKLGYAHATEQEAAKAYEYSALEKFPVYFGTHPAVMNDIVASHAASYQDWLAIKKKYFWSPLLWGRVRYKTFKRVKYEMTK